MSPYSRFNMVQAIVDAGDVVPHGAVNVLFLVVAVLRDWAQTGDCPGNGIDVDTSVLMLHLPRLHRRLGLLAPGREGELPDPAVRNTISTYL